MSQLGKLSWKSQSNVTTTHVGFNPYEKPEEKNKKEKIKKPAKNIGATLAGRLANGKGDVWLSSRSSRALLCLLLLIQRGVWLGILCSYSRMHNLANTPISAWLMTSSARRFGKQFSGVYPSSYSRVVLLTL